MTPLQEFEKSVSDVMITAKNLVDEMATEMHQNAPIIVRQRFCAELVKVARDNPNKIPSDVPEMMSILSAITLLDELYPEAKPKFVNNMRD
jgi:hypothetical protein